MKLRCVVVDDESIARELLTDYISKIEELELVGCFANALDATHTIRTKKIDLLFIDIEMPHISGIDFIQDLDPKIMIVLTTAYSEFAIKGYELGVLDYLLKPIQFKRFYQAVNKAFAKSAKVVPRVDPAETPSLSHKEDYIFVKTDYKMMKINHFDILYMTSKGAYVQIALKTGKKIMVLQSMNYMEEVLPPEFFYRVHRSHIVNIQHVSSIEGNMIQIDDKEKINLSKSKRENFIARIDKYNLLR